MVNLSVPRPVKRLVLYAVLAITVLSVAGCLRAYRPDVQQGNLVTAELLTSLESGMSRREVRYTLGSPMIEDPFHADRWDYVYTLREGRSRQRKQSVVTVVFENDRLKYVEGDPNIQEISETGDSRLLAGATTKAKNFWDRLFRRRDAANQ